MVLATIGAVIETDVDHLLDQLVDDGWSCAAADESVALYWLDLVAGHVDLAINRKPGHKFRLEVVGDEMAS